VTVSVTGEVHFNAYANSGDFDPLGEYFGRGIGGPDVSGGTVDINFTLPDGLYLFLDVTGRQATTQTAQHARMTIVGRDTVQERFQDGITLPTNGASSTAFRFPTPNSLLRSSPTQATIQFSTLNINGDGDLSLFFRAQFWTPTILAKFNPRQLALVIQGGGN